MAVYKTKGVCSRSIEFEIEGDIVKSVKFNGGCNGKDVYKRQDAYTICTGRYVWSKGKKCRWAA